MRQDEARRAKRAATVRNRPIREVVWNRLLERRRFAQKQIGSVSDVDQGIRPSCIARIGDRATVAGDAQSKRRRAAPVVHAKRRHPGAGYSGGPAIDVLGKPDQLFAGFPPEARIKQLGRSPYALSDARRSHDEQGTRAPRDERGVQQEKRQSTKMIPVQVADDDRIHRRRIDAEAVHRDERRRAEVDQQRRAWRLEIEGRVRLTAAAKCVAAAQNAQRHT